ncbi:hypothetical protein GJV26_02555 [Massilia dura]|uniref:Uncharacterized protein n=1 Tax=Pseudoduganella dura TaxID=321982 RepID=A0A6I3X3E0_9BURK|nr:hypothetical protein [Pseudoduganella dura]MUI11374.1 hypothetical protein [Pseudoduganella dura]GGX95744.1 hypothetical protein GCM10007386_28330 [Pseudoduganella dura]
MTSTRQQLAHAQMHSGRRRILLKCGLATAMLPLLSAKAALPVQAHGQAAISTMESYDAVVVDMRHARARAHGLAQRGRAGVIRGMNGDPTTVWQELLDPLWRNGPALVSGMTTGPALFCIEQLAHGHGMRVLERSVQGTDQALVTWLIGPARKQES